MSKTSKVTLLVSVLAVLVMAGCEKAPAPAEPQQPEAVTEAVEEVAKDVPESVTLDITSEAAKKLGIKGVLCLKCGHVEGAELCCKPGAKTCPKCGLHKGSMGCCDPKVVECLRHNQKLQTGQRKPDVLQAD